MTPTHSSAPIGVFDSGIGGLSILKALRAEMPHESFVYFADSAHHPYGPKGDAFVIDRSLTIAQQLVDNHHIKALVMACNTATAAAIAVLRARHPSLPIIGVEPALKPAVAASRTKRIAVLATQGTLHSAKFLALKASLADQADFVCTPCHGLADMIERSIDTDNTTDLIAALAEFTRVTGLFGTQNGAIDTVVLGCTHYPLVMPYFEAVLRSAGGQGVQIVDNGHAVARQVMQRCSAVLLVQQQPDLALAQAVPQLTLISSGAPQHLHSAVARWLLVQPDTTPRN
jgi:glutamate racemase